jgi:signal transduction histidine kinase
MLISAQARLRRSVDATDATGRTGTVETRAQGTHRAIPPPPSRFLDGVQMASAQQLVQELSHDLRQPLTSLNMNLQSAVRLLRAASPQRDAAVEAISDCLSVELDVVRMLSRTLQRFEALMNPALPMPLNEMVSDVVSAVCQIEASWQKRVLVHLSDPSPLVRGDAWRLRLALIGFVRRAVIYLEEQKCVAPLTLETGTTRDRAQIVLRCVRAPVFESNMEGVIVFVEALTRRVGGTVSFDARDTEATIVISLPTASALEDSATGGNDGN